MTASGPVSFLGMWDAMCTTMLSTGVRRGAMMATLRCDHPDVVEFIDAKREPGALRNFNLSVLVSDAFMRAVDEDAPWRLVFPAPPAAAIVERHDQRTGAVGTPVRERPCLGGTGRAVH